MKSSRQILLLVGTMCLHRFRLTGYNLWPALISDFILRWDLTSRAAGWIGGIFYVGYLAAIWPLSNITDRIDQKNLFILHGVDHCFSFRLCINGRRFLDCDDLAISSRVGLAGTYMPGLKLLTDIVPNPLKAELLLVHLFLLCRCCFISELWNKSKRVSGLREVWLFAAVAHSSRCFSSG